MIRRAGIFLLLQALLCLAPAISLATVAVDVSSENVGNVDPVSYSHAGGVSPEGVLVFVNTRATLTTDMVSSVTYGGSALTRVRGDNDTVGATGWSYIYFLGESVPTGTQTVVVDYTGTPSVNFYVATVTLDGAANLEVIDHDGVAEDQANPQVTLSFGGREAMSFCMLYSGVATVPTSFADQTRVQDHDYGAATAAVDRLTTAGTADDTMGFTQVSDDVAFSAAAISEVVAAAGTATRKSLMGVGQ